MKNHLSTNQIHCTVTNGELNRFAEMNYFYQPEIKTGSHFLDNDEFTHCTKVLRNKVGGTIGILDGKGGLYKVRITEISGKRCLFEIEGESSKTPKTFHHHIALAPTKNIDRTEWFVEKACELGLDEISFILTKNSERNKLRIDRLQKKAVSALKQSKSGYITQINELAKFSDFIKNTSQIKSDKFIAYVEAGLPYFASVAQPKSSILTLIGPEGDFDPAEVEVALLKGFQKISLGSNTLRTETAGITACQFVNFVNGY